MCIYSNMIGEWHHPTWPVSPYPTPVAPSPNAIPWPKIQYDPSLAAQMLEVLKKLEAIDKRLNNLDCKVEKKQKKKIEAKLKRIAARPATLRNDEHDLLTRRARRRRPLEQ